MERIGGFWDKGLHRYLAIKDESRKAILYPKIVELINDLCPTSLLDYGCGDGELLDILACQSSVNISAFDPSSSAVTAIQRRLAGKDVNIYQKSDQITNGAYDVVICSLVMMTIATEKDLAELIRNIHRAKKIGGVAIFAITHPCFRDEQFSTFVTEYTNKSQFGYFNEGKEFEVTIFDRASDQKIQFFDYHWSLSKTINLLIRGGFAVRELFELKDMPQHGNRNFPPYLIILVE